MASEEYGFDVVLAWARTLVELAEYVKEKKDIRELSTSGVFRCKEVDDERLMPEIAGHWLEDWQELGLGDLELPFWRKEYHEPLAPAGGWWMEDVHGDLPAVSSVEQRGAGLELLVLELRKVKVGSSILLHDNNATTVIMRLIDTQWVVGRLSKP